MNSRLFKIMLGVFELALSIGSLLHNGPDTSNILSDLLIAGHAGNIAIGCSFLICGIIH